MPTMLVVKVNGFWHITASGMVRQMKCGVEWPQGAPTLTLGGGRECGNDPDPPVSELCLECFPWHKEKGPTGPTDPKPLAVFFVCAGVYGEGDAKKFSLVGPTHGLPYITTQEFAQRLFRLCMHHSSLYQVNAWFDKVRLRTWGEDRRGRDPVEIELTPAQKAELQKASEDPWGC